MELRSLKILCFTTSIFSYLYSQNDKHDVDQSVYFSMDSSAVHNVKQKPEQGVYVSSATNSLYHDLSDQEYQNLVMHAVRSEMVCRQIFHMSLAQKEQMKRLSYDDFVTDLLARNDLSDQAIVALWNEYKKKRVWNRNNEKQDNEIKIKESLKKRELKREQKVLQEKNYQLKLHQHKQRHDSIVLHDMNDLSPFQKDRKEALLKTKANGYATYEQNYHVDAQTTALLAIHGIDHQHCQSLSGTVFQHQLFQEAAACYKKAAKIMFDHAVKNSLIAPYVLQLAQTSFESTKVEIFDLSMQLNDLAELLAETSLSVFKAVVESTCNLIDMVWNYKQTAKQISQLLVSVLQTLGGALNAYDYQSSLHVQHIQAVEQAFGADICAFNQLCDLSKKEFAYWYQISSGQEKVQALSRCVADLMLQPKLIGMAGKACAGILSKALNLKSLEAITALSEELNFAECLAQGVEQQLATTVGEVMPEIEQSLTSLMETEVSILKHGINFTGITEISALIEEFHKIKGVVPSSDRLLIRQVDNALRRISKKIDRTSIENLTKLYAQKKIEETTVYAALDHFCNAELGLIRCKDTGDMILNISGGHLYGACEAIERAGFVKIQKIVTLPSGALNYFMEDVFTGRILNKTIFPKSWDAKQLCDAAWKLYEGAGEVTLVSKGQYFKKSVMNSVKMEIYCVSKTEGLLVDKILTCYPV